MTNSEQPPKDQKRIAGREDWFGSGLDEFGAFSVERCWNGIIVRPLTKDGAFARETLVFQDQTQFVDWFQGWFAFSSMGDKS